MPVQTTSAGPNECANCKQIVSELQALIRNSDVQVINSSNDKQVSLCMTYTTNKIQGHITVEISVASDDLFE